MTQPLIEATSDPTDPSVEVHDTTPVPGDLLTNVLLLDHVEALKEHISKLIAARQTPKARDFVAQVIKHLEEELGPPSPSIWMLRELRHRPHLYIDKFNVLLTGKLAETAARALDLLEKGRAPSSIIDDAVLVCQSVARNSRGKYRVLGT